MSKPKDKKMTKKDIRERIKKYFVSGQKIKLADGGDGVFVRYCAGHQRAWVLIGDMSGKLRTEEMKALITQNLGAEFAI